MEREGWVELELEWEPKLEEVVDWVERTESRLEEGVLAEAGETRKQ